MKLLIYYREIFPSLKMKLIINTHVLHLKIELLNASCNL